MSVTSFVTYDNKITYIGYKGMPSNKFSYQNSQIKLIFISFQRQKIKKEKKIKLQLLLFQEKKGTNFKF